MIILVAHLVCSLRPAARGPVPARAPGPVPGLRRVTVGSCAARARPRRQPGPGRDWQSAGRALAETVTDRISLLVAAGTALILTCHDTVTVPVTVPRRRAVPRPAETQMVRLQPALPNLQL